jgi:hypothetical protein
VIVPRAVVRSKIESLLDSLLRHDGFGEMRVEVRILKRGQREVILHCGKQYRYVVDAPDAGAEGSPANGGGEPQ